MLHCGKTNIARAAKPPYCAQLKFMGYSCIKIVHRRSQAPAPRRKGYRLSGSTKKANARRPREATPVETEALLGALPHPLLVIGDGLMIEFANTAAEDFFQMSAGVLCRRAPEHDYVKSPAEFAWLAGAREGVLRLNREGWLVLVVTNQRGVARGLMTANDVEAIHARAQRELREIGAHVDAFYYCPHGDEDACACRKPQPGMLIEVARRFNVPLEDTYMVGDSQRDVEAAAAAGARPVLVLTGKGRKTREAGTLPPGTEIHEDLAAFAERLAP